MPLLLNLQVHAAIPPQHRCVYMLGTKLCATVLSDLLPSGFAGSELAPHVRSAMSSGQHAFVGETVTETFYLLTRTEAFRKLTRIEIFRVLTCTASLSFTDTIGEILTSSHKSLAKLPHANSQI